MAANFANGHAAPGDSSLGDVRVRDQQVTDPRVGVITGEMDQWEADKRRQKAFYDDGSMSFFWRAHRVLALIVFGSVLWFTSMYLETPDDTTYNTKRALCACVVVVCVFGATHIPDGPFRRPHPAFWKVITALCVVYELVLVFMLFQTAHDARQLMKHIDPSLGEPLPEKSYGGECRIYDSSHPEDPWHYIREKLDIFVPIHFFGWFFKTLVLRDYWMCMVISIMFELLEYTFEHQLLNFSECWWDHWFMDALVCNGAGIYLGMKALKYLNMKEYYWRSTWSIKTYRGKVSRIVRQFTPYFWTEFDWRPTSNLKRWLTMLWLIFIILLAELNTFYMKTTLWVPHNHVLNGVRLVFSMLWAAVGCREYFQWMEDPKFSKMGSQMWINTALVFTELLITFKFEWNLITKPLPTHIAACWAAGITILVGWTIWNFYLHGLFIRIEKRFRRMRRRKDADADRGWGSDSGGYDSENMSDLDSSPELKKEL